MKSLRNVLNTILRVLAGASFLVMVVLTCWQVFTRYLLGSPSTWSEELVSYMFAWASLLGASLVTGERGHMNIPIVVDRMGPGAKKAFGILGEVIAFLFSLIILVYGGVKISSLAMGQKYSDASGMSISCGTCDFKPSIFFTSSKIENKKSTATCD